MYLVISVKLDSLSANTSGIDPLVANQSAILPFLGGFFVTIHACQNIYPRVEWRGLEIRGGNLIQTKSAF